TATFPPPNPNELSTTLSAPPRPRPAPGFLEGAVVPGYRPVRKLGEGTYGKVWLYQEERTGIQVAIKFFTRGWGMEWLLLQAEVKHLALLHADPGIVQLEDVEPEASPPYYIMSYAPGGSLADRLRGGQCLPLPEALKIFREVT